MSIRCAKQIQSAARVEGEESLRYIQCDLDESKGYPVAVLFWPESDGRRVHYPLEPSELLPEDTAGAARIYTGTPLHIPKALAEIEQFADRDAPDRSRLGFFFLPENPTE